MFNSLIISLFVYVIYAFVYWLRKSNKSLKLYVAPHKRIAWSIWIYCGFLCAVATTMANFTGIDYQRFHRPEYGQYKGWYFPYGHYSDLRIGNIQDKSNVNVGLHIIHTPILLGHNWDELYNEEPDIPYQKLMNAFHTYDSDSNSETFGRGIVLRIYNLDSEVASSGGDESEAYKNVINSLVSDSSFYQICKKFSPYPAIETDTYLTISFGDDTPALFKKHITVFANSRAYELNFYVDKEADRPADTNTFEFLDDEFIKIAKRLDLHSYKEWQEQEQQYLGNLKI